MSVYDDDDDGATTLFRRVPAAGSPNPPPPLEPPLQVPELSQGAFQAGPRNAVGDSEICEGCRMAFPGAGSDASGMCPECATTLWQRDTPPAGLIAPVHELEPDPEFQRFARPWPYVLGFSAAAVAGAMLLLVAERVLPPEAWSRAYTAAKLRWLPPDPQPERSKAVEGRACQVRRE